MVACLTWDRGVAGSSISGVTVLCPWARHVNPCLVLAQSYKTRLDIQCSWKDVDWDVNQTKETKAADTNFPPIVHNVGPPTAHQWYAISMAYRLMAVGGPTLSQWPIAGGPLVAWCCVLAGYTCNFSYKIVFFPDGKTQDSVTEQTAHMYVLATFWRWFCGIPFLHREPIISWQQSNNSCVGISVWTGRYLWLISRWSVCGYSKAIKTSSGRLYCSN